MENEMNRTLAILADREPVGGYARARLTGAERLGLSPELRFREFFLPCGFKRSIVKYEWKKAMRIGNAGTVFFVPPRK